jgi:hypothetical protein
MPDTQSRPTTARVRPSKSWIGASELMHEPPLPDFRSI